MTAVCLKPKSTKTADILSTTFMSFDCKTSFWFLKELTATCISTVLYLRNIFPEVYFEPQNFEGVNLKILKEGNKQSFPGRIQQWLEGAFEAIDKKYLKHLMLDIQDAETNLTLEIYTMTFNYKQGNETLNFGLSTLQSNKNCGFKESNTKLNLINLLQMCSAVACNSGNLPSKIALAMKLSYHENTPEDYQPKGYTAWIPQDPVFPKQTRSVEIGGTETPYHYFKFICMSCLNEKFFKSMENVNQFSGSHQSPQKTSDTQASTSCSKHQHKKRVPHVSKKRIAIEGTSKNYLRSDFRSKKVRCVCLSSKKSATVISCLACKNLAHAECFGILQPQTMARIKFYCHLCHQAQTNFKCHDRVLMNLKTPSDQQKLAVLRKVLRFCTKNYTSKITLKQMKKIAGSVCQIEVVEIILNLMVEKEIAVPQSKRKTYLIDKNELANKLADYFYSIQNSKQT